MFNTVKIGEEIIFTKLKYQYPDKFTLGKKYIVIDITIIPTNEKTLIKVIDDSNDEIWINLVYFNDVNILREWKLKRIIEDE